MLDLLDKAARDVGSGEADEDVVMEYHICEELGLELVDGQPNSSTLTLPKDDAPALRRAIQALRSRDPLEPVSVTAEDDSAGLEGSSSLDLPLVSPDDSRGPSS